VNSQLRYVVVVPGANALLLVTDLVTADLADAAVVSCQNEIPLAVTKRAFEMARAASSAVTIWNPAPPPKDGYSDILPLVDVLCVNETEALAISKQETMDSAIRELLKSVQTVIITMGKAGCMFSTKGMAQPKVIPAYDAGSVVDTTGAGDCFCGALAFFLARKYTLDRAIGLANQVAAVSVTRKGAQASYPRLTECPTEVVAAVSTV
jgi:ribokinase